ncbi:unnamed protein product, partial [Brenthis ino]
MVLATRKRTPPVDSIFRPGLRVRTEPAASARRAAMRPCRPLPHRLRKGILWDVTLSVVRVVAKKGEHKK